MAEVVREVMVGALCNTSTAPQVPPDTLLHLPQLGEGSVEFNVTDEFLNTSSQLTMCQRCFLQTPLDQVPPCLRVEPYLPRCSPLRAAVLQLTAPGPTSRQGSSCVPPWQPMTRLLRM